jgi:hypothetical protein
LIISLNFEPLDSQLRLPGRRHAFGLFSRTAGPCNYTNEQ